MLKNKKVGVISMAAVILLALIGAAGHYGLAGHTHVVIEPAITASAPAATPSDTSNTSELQSTTQQHSLSQQASTGLQGTSLNHAPPTTTPEPTSTTQSSPPAANPFDPTTFAQYEKYHDASSALWADVQTGSGEALQSGQKATVYYRGWLTNGTMFDQSRADSSGQLQPFSFTVGSHQVISGWDEGLIGMKPGGVRLLIVPPAVGYGATAQGSIPANSLLVFQVQFLSAQ